MKIDGLTFAETVERLAEKYGVELRREDGDGARRPARGPAARQGWSRPTGSAQEFYAEQLAHARRAGRPGSSCTSAASTRTPPSASASGFAPRDGEALLKHLRGRGFSRGGAGRRRARRRSRPLGRYDRFRGRLLWPIRDASGDDDRLRRAADLRGRPDRGEVPQHPRDHDLQEEPGALRHRPGPHARSAAPSQAVVVEGYTDVMACHLAGVGTAVASCGTAFGDDHAQVLRRFMDDHEEFRGEVIFTFDGDAAGQKAALKAFAGDQNFVSQTYVAVEPDGLDPCDLRIKKGDAAVRELVARRVPLYRFVLGNVVAKYDLDRADGRVDALRESARLVLEHPRQVQGRRLRPRDRRHGRRRRRRGPRRGTPRRAPRPAARRRPSAATSRRPRAAPAPPERRRGRTVPDLRDPRFAHRARDAQAASPAPDGDRPDDHRHRRRRLHPPDLPRGLGAGRGRRRHRAPAPTTPAGSPQLRDAADATRPSSSADQRARGRAAARRSPTRAYVAQHVVAPAGAHRAAPDRRGQVQAAAHQPGRARRRLQPDVRRAGRARGSTAARCATADRARREAGPRLRARAGTAAASRVERGSGCWPAAADERPASAAPATRSTSPRPAAPGRRSRPSGCRGSRSRPPTGTSRPRPCGSARSARWGEQRPEHAFAIDEPGRLLELVRERVTASVVLQRHVPVDGRRGVRVIARRAPAADRPTLLALRVRRGHRPRRPGRPARPPRRRSRPPATRSARLSRSSGFLARGPGLANVCRLHDPL